MPTATMTLTSSLTYHYWDVDGNRQQSRHHYTLIISATGELADVYNSYGYSVQKTSECWQRFAQKYSARAAPAISDSD